MRRVATVLVLVGGVLMTTGAAVLAWPVGLIVAGVLLLAAGIDLGNDGEP